MIKFNTLKQWLLSLGAATFVWSGAANAQTVSPVISDEVYSNLPFQMAKVQQPTFPDHSRSITEFGAVAEICIWKKMRWCFLRLTIRNTPL